MRSGLRADIQLQKRLAGAACALLLAGCVVAPPLPTAASANDVPQLCRTLFERLDHAAAVARVGDAGAARIEGFPWLRINRPLASFRTELETRVRREAWLQRLAETDAESRGHEVSNLPANVRAAEVGRWRSAAAAMIALPGELEAAQADCRQRLNTDLLGDDFAFESLIGAAQPRDAYHDWQRVLGLYPLVRRIVLPRIATHQEQRKDAISASFDTAAPTLRYAAPGSQAGESTPRPQALARDALGIPRPTTTERTALLAAHAPVWAIETRTAADRPGALVRRGGAPVVDTDHPVEYRHWSWTRFRDEVLVQLSYVVWFPERPAEGWLDIYAGHLDGLIWRVTLRADGAPLAYESIHPCGCYYTVFTTSGWRVRVMEPGEEPVFAPQSAPRLRWRQRVVIQLESGTHYIAGIEAAGAGDAEPLVPARLDSLRSLPVPGGGHESAYDSNGLIPSSRRPERFLLWPLGVPSAGAMRQWGTHAIAFIGKRHFDDPYLLDSLLEEELQ